MTPQRPEIRGLALVRSCTQASVADGWRCSHGSVLSSPPSWSRASCRSRRAPATGRSPRGLLDFAKVRSVATHSSASRRRRSMMPALVLRGAGHYETGCAPCHGAPGHGRAARDGGHDAAAAGATRPRCADGNRGALLHRQAWHQVHRHAGVAGRRSAMTKCGRWWRFCAACRGWMRQRISGSSTATARATLRRSFSRSARAVMAAMVRAEETAPSRVLPVNSGVSAPFVEGVCRSPALERNHGRSCSDAR